MRLAALGSNEERSMYMEPVVGVFASRNNAEESAERLRQTGLKQITLLTPSDLESKVQTVRTEDMERRGMGTALGGLVGAALGLAAGVGIGAVSAAVPSSGAIPQLLGAAIFGVAGAAAGIAAGRALESTFCDGLPKDELCICEDAVRQGRFVLIAFTDRAHKASTVRGVMARSGAASLDAARGRWRFGRRPFDEVTYLSNEQVSEARRLLRGKKPLQKHKTV
ncbi:MAG: hypothetical protein DMG57_15490 [Acidobacteria bacterium]|nr:MAG: hypothetical protein DMG57_15490 [Acidobacteriota bacterium]